MQKYTEGEYSLPYIDKELENKLMRQTVDYLINEEKKAVPFVYEEEEVIPEMPPRQPIDEIFQHECMSKEAYYESLCQEEALLGVLLLRRREFWGGEDKKLNTYISLVQKQQRSIQDDIDKINLERFRAQKETGIRLRRLKYQISDLEESIESERQEIERLSLS